MVSLYINAYSELGNCDVGFETVGELGLKLGLGSCYNVDFMKILIAGSFG